MPFRSPSAGFTLPRAHLIFVVAALAFLLDAAPARAQLAYQIGGTQSDTGRAIAIDAAGNVAIAGQFRGTVDFDPGPGVTELTSVSSFTNYVASYTPAGALRFVVPLGPGGGLVNERGVAFDAAGNVFVTGWFTGVGDFDPGPDLVSLVGTDGNTFVASYGPTGAYRFAFQIGGDELSVLEAGRDIAVDSIGNVYVAGLFPGEADFDPDEVDELIVESEGNTDAFLASYSNDGEVRFAFALGGTAGDNAWGVALDDADNVYVTGFFRESADFDPGPLVATLTSAGQEDAFLASYTSSGAYRYAVRMGGTQRDEARSVDVDDAGQAFITGFFLGTADFDPAVGLLELTAVANRDLFVASYDSVGGVRFAFAAGDTGDDTGTDLVVDSTGALLLTGQTFGTVDLDPGPGAAEMPPFPFDAFIARYSNTGVFESLDIYEAPSTADSFGYSITVDPSDRPHLVGDFSGANVDFDPGDGTALFTSNGQNDIFITSITSTPSVPMLVPAAGAIVAASLGALGWRRARAASTRS